MAGGLPAEEGAGDLLVAVRVVVEHPGRQADRGVQQGVADRLRPRDLLDEVAVARGGERGEPVERRALLVRLRRQLADEERRRGEQVDVDADQPVGCHAAHRVGVEGAHVAALGDVAGVAEAAHQLRPGLRDAAGAPADLRRLGGEAVAGDGRQHQVEGVLGAAAVRGRVGERADGVQQLEDRAGPAVGHDQRQRVLVRRPHVDEVDVHAVDLGHELRQRVELRLGRAPVVVGRPVARERLQGRQLNALRPVVRRAPCWASASPRCAGAGRPAAPLESRRGRGGSRLRCPAAAIRPPFVWPAPGSDHAPGAVKTRRQPNPPEPRCCRRRAGRPRLNRPRFTQADRAA